MRLLWLIPRGFWISLVIFWALISYGGRRAMRFGISVADKERLRGEVMATTFERLGATFIKFGQILSTRPDLLGPGYLEPLSRLQDDVAPCGWRSIQKVLKRSLSEQACQRLVYVDPKPVAAASVAQVHRATLDDGTPVALKIQRPGVQRLITGDMSILTFWARVLNVIPSLRPLSLPGAAHHFGVSLKGQLDFRVEAQNNRRFAKNFKGVEGIAVPTLIDGICTEYVLGMEFVEGVKGSEPDKVGGDRKRLARLGADAILQMIFHDGFVHADLHPGNIILTPDGRIVFIDLGMVATIPSDLVQPWLLTFMALGQQDGAEVGRLLYIYAPSVGDFDYADYERDIAAHFSKFHGKSIGEVEISEVIGGVWNVLRRYRVHIDPSFTVVNVALLVAEGLGKQLDPDIDVVQMAIPVIMKAMAAGVPKGIEPRRTVPTAA